MEYAALVRVELVRERTVVYEAGVDGPECAAKIANELIGNSGREKFLCLHMNIKLSIVSVEVVSVGSIDETIAKPAEVFKGAFLANAARIIVAHNHPSGSLEPSSGDLSLTERLAKAGELLGITLMDHLIVNGESYTSLRRTKPDLFEVL